MITFKYEIYDFAGKLLLHGEGTENEKLDIRELMTGAYIITIKSENENVRVVRFVKN